MHASWIAAAALVACATNAPGASTHPATPREVFPQPTAPIVLSSSEPMDYESLVAAFSASTGLTIVTDRESREQLSGTPVELFGDVELPPGEVYPVVESMLAAEGFLLTRVGSGGSPHVFRLFSADSRRLARSDATIVAAEDLPAYEQHPAVLITTFVHLEAMDARQLTNSLRSLLTDTNTQSAIPVGNTNVLILSGRGRDVVQLARALLEVDARERALREARDAAGTTAGATEPADS